MNKIESFKNFEQFMITDLRFVQIFKGYFFCFLSYIDIILRACYSEMHTQMLP